MIIYNIKGEITPETTSALLEVLNDRNPGELTRIYLDSIGGDIAEGVMLLDIINKEPENFELVGTNLLASCAFELFFLARCPKHITPLTRGMHHLPYAMMPINIKGNLADKEAKRRFKEMNDDLLPRVESLFNATDLTKKERQYILKGEDQYFSHKRMLEILEFNRKFLSENVEDGTYSMPATTKRSIYITEGESEMGSDEPEVQIQSKEGVETILYSSDMIVGILVEKGDIVPMD